jgi:hypothetical protein
VRLRFLLSLVVLAWGPGFGFAKLTPEATAAFEQYVERAEPHIAGAEVRDLKLRSGELRIESGHAGGDAQAPGGMIQDWIGSMFIPGATLDQTQAVLRDYANYKAFYAPKVVESKQLSRSGDEYDVFLRLYEKHLLTVVLNSTYHVRYSTPEPRHLIVTSRSTRIAEVQEEKEQPVGDDDGFLWRLNSYWRFLAADGGIYARCEAISLSRDVPLALGWMLKGFIEKFPKESMLNTLRGTRDAIEKRKKSSPGSVN